MSQLVTNHDVFTMEEAAGFLRIPVDVAEELAAQGVIPARQIRGEWRFLRSAIEAWLSQPDYRRVLYNQAGALKDDESLTDMLNAIYAARGRPEVDDRTER